MSGCARAYLSLGIAGSGGGSDRGDNCSHDNGSSDSSGSGGSSDLSNRGDNCSRDNGSSSEYGDSGIYGKQSWPIPVAVITASAGSGIGSHRSDGCIHDNGDSDSDESS